MAILENGRIIKKMGMDHTYTQMVRDTKGGGRKTKSMGMGATSIRMEINITESGETIIVMATERCSIATMLLTRGSGRKGSSMAEVSLRSSKEITTMVNG
jgi:hypothetical protein